MILSIVIICWNDLKVIKDCLSSIYAERAGLELEVVVSDNGSTDGSIDYIRKHYPEVRIVSNGANLGFAKGNNAGIRVARGKYVLILNPDTIIHKDALAKLVEFAETHAEAGAFGCRVLNPDGSDQCPAVPLPTLMGTLLSAPALRWLGCLSKTLLADRYPGWDGTSVREIGRQSGCCLLVRRDLLNELNGFDERFFYHCEETDLCCRIWKAGWKILFCPNAVITHLGGQSVGRFPIRFAIETFRSRYRYFYKHFGLSGMIRFRQITLLHLWIRRIGYGVVALLDGGKSDSVKNRLEMYRIVIRWNTMLNPVRFINTGEEPNLGYEPMAPAPKMVDSFS